MMWYEFFSKSLVSAHCASFMSRCSLLRGEGSAYPLLGNNLNFFISGTSFFDSKHFHNFFLQVTEKKWCLLRGVEGACISLTRKIPVVDFFRIYLHVIFTFIHEPIYVAVVLWLASLAMWLEFLIWIFGNIFLQFSFLIIFWKLSWYFWMKTDNLIQERYSLSHAEHGTTR